MATRQNYYANPAFCQQSEFYNQRALSPPKNVRHPPIGAQTCHLVLDTSVGEKPLEDGIEEQEFYEEVVVDDKGFITEKKFVVVAQNNEGKKYIQVPQDEGKCHNRSRVHVSPKNTPETKNQQTKQRYEYIPLQEQDASRFATPKKMQYEEQISSRVHRYAVIEAEEETELTGQNGKYALVPVEELKSIVPSQSRNRYEYIQGSPQQKPAQTRYEYIQNTQNTPPKQNTRYEYLQPRPSGNPVATQKLHEFLSTPKKTPQKVLSPPSQRRLVAPPHLSPIPKDPFQTPKTTPQKYTVRGQHSKAQQKLNYAIGANRQLAQTHDKRHTAIVAPMCSSPVQSVYSETTYSNKSESWMNLSVYRKTPVQATLAVAALMMLMCGGVTSGLCFYMISIMGRLYYLDFSVVAGFTCLVLGLLGFRARNVYWLPNRNYISGYLVLSVFSLLTCAGLLVLLVMQPPPGSPLADMTSGAVCGISVLSLVLAASGIVASYCCKYPPPDNRVQHCSPGFTV